MSSFSLTDNVLGAGEGGQKNGETVEIKKLKR